MLRARSGRISPAAPFAMLLLCTAIAGAPLRAAAAPARPSLGQKLGAFARGLVKDGPGHTWQGIKERPKIFGALVLATGFVGGFSHMAGVNPEPYLMTAAAGLYGWSVFRALPSMKRAVGLARWRAVGAEVAWPAAMIGTSFVVGHAVGGESTRNPTGGTTALSFGRAFGDGAILGGDDPLVLVSTLRTRR